MQKSKCFDCLFSKYHQLLIGDPVALMKPYIVIFLFFFLAILAIKVGYLELKLFKMIDEKYLGP